MSTKNEANEQTKPLRYVSTQEKLLTTRIFENTTEEFENCPEKEKVYR